MATNKEIPIDDSELDQLMAELEAETADTVVAPKVAAAAPEPELKASAEELNVDELAELDAVIEPVVEVVSKPEPKPEPAPQPEPEPVAEKPKLAAVPSTPKTEPAPAERPIVPMAEEDPAPNPIPAKRAELQFFVDVGAFRDETRVSETNLDKCMIEQAGHRAYYGEQAARAEAQHARLKVRFEVLEAQLYDKHRKLLVASGEKTTEKQVENAVKLDPKWLAGKNTVIEAETIAAVNKSLVDSLKDRRDMIIQLGADRRDEGKGAVRILAQQQAHDDLKSRALAAAGRAA